MNPSFEQALTEVWRQALIENANFVVLGTERYPVRRTPKRGLRQVDFVFDGNANFVVLGTERYHCRQTSVSACSKEGFIAGSDWFQDSAPAHEPHSPRSPRIALRLGTA